MDFFQDVACWGPEYSFDVIFDVGANIGNFTAYAREQFPLATIVSFEPIPPTFSHLQKRLSSNEHQVLENLAVGASNCTVEVDYYVDMKLADRNSLTGDVLLLEDAEKARATVEVITLDSYCADHNVDSIDFLKIDTEGFDLKVLQGADGMLKRGSIKFLEVEVSMNPENDFHIPFGTIIEYLKPYGYRLFGIYEQQPEKRVTVPILRRSNMVFMIARNFKRRKQ
ncbi:FkbM family methyltransferase [Lewinella sp. W8]|uniref:FkbM family methyltransferase n=1 Tax=Lewinella sp. W8 TaxID=2528208 RepID=UPI0015674A3B